MSVIKSAPSVQTLEDWTCGKIPAWEFIKHSKFKLKESYNLLKYKVQGNDQQTAKNADLIDHNLQFLEVF